MRRILVVKLATLGDLLTATPALRALRTTFPAAHLAVLATPGFASALRGLDTVDSVLTFDKYAFDRPADAARNASQALQLATRLRRGRWDALVLLHHLTTRFGIAKYAALALGSGAPVRAGIDNGRGWFLTHRAPDFGFGERHEVDYWLDAVEQLGARRPTAPRLELVIAPDDDLWAAARWRELQLGEMQANGVAMLVVGSGAYSVARRWAPHRFVEVGRQLRDTYGLTPLVLGGLAADEASLARRVAAGIGRGVRVAPPAPSPQALGALLRRCSIVVANDSGPVHVATAVRTPVVAIFGPSNHRAWGPYPPTDPRHQVAREPLACSPCIHRGHAFGTPQGCPARTCLAILEVPSVLSAVERALGVTSPVMIGSAR